MTTLNRILITGGGIGGLAMAAALRKVGLPAEIFEQSPSLGEVGAGVGLWSNALASLDQLGAGDAIRGSGVPIRLMAGANQRGDTISRVDLDELGPEFAAAACFVVPRPKLLSALSACVPEHLVHTSARVASVTQDETSVTLELADGRREVGDLLIGADGLHSVIRTSVVPRDSLRYSGQTCFRGIAPVALAGPYVLREIQGPGRRGSVCAIDEHSVYWWAAHNSPPNQLVSQGERQAHLLERYGDFPFGLPEAIAATSAGAILQHDLFDRAPVNQYAAGRVALIGDAAHPTTPNLGQGANMAIDDALSLARALRDEATLVAALARYQRERLPRTRAIVERSWSFGRLCRWDSSLGVRLRETLMRMTPQRVLRDALRWQILEDVGTL